jgi:hypothetical protein
MAEHIEPGAMVECSDYPLGGVERVEDDGALLVRPARADYLLRIPPRLIGEAHDGRVVLNATLEEVEQFALAPEAGGLGRRDVTPRATDAGPRGDEVLGRQPGNPPTSPATG